MEHVKEKREIKFRAWDKARKEYLSAGQILISIEPHNRPKQSHFYLDILTHPDMYNERFVIEQYTGLKDKNGNEIFEGDIVNYDSKIVSDKPLKCLIEYEEAASILCINRLDKYNNGHSENAVIFHKSVGENCEIVGNIHDLDR